MTTWTHEMRETEIARQLELIESNSVPMAVVDYTCNWRRLGSTARFGVRDLGHVKGYQLRPVALNRAALQRIEF